MFVICFNIQDFLFFFLHFLHVYYYCGVLFFPIMTMILFSCGAENIRTNCTEINISWKSQLLWLAAKCWKFLLFFLWPWWHFWNSLYETSPTGWPSSPDFVSSVMCPAGQVCGFAVLLCQLLSITLWSVPVAGASSVLCSLTQILRICQPSNSNLTYHLLT